MTNFIETIGDSLDDSPSDSSTPSFVDCWISFGGNIGDVKATFNAALALLSLHCHIQLGKRSGIYSTAPMGSQSGSPFLNSVCGLKTLLSPMEILRVLQSVENQLGRVRDFRWGPRTLDLDLLNYGDRIVNELDLVVPHPSLTYRRFVLDPLVEVAPDWRHPVHSESTRQLVARLNLRPLTVSLIDASQSEVEALAAQLLPRFPHVRFATNVENSSETLSILLRPSSSACGTAIVDLRHSPGCMLEQLTSAFTAIFDAPERICDWS